MLPCSLAVLSLTRATAWQFPSVTFVHEQVAERGGIEYGAVQSFLLEKCRVLTQAEGERSYHIFYQLVRGAPPEMRKRLHLLNLEEYAFINPGCLDVPGVVR